MSHLPKLMLIDSNALIHRSFHALPPMSTPKGELVNAVYGFANALLKAIKDENPDYIVACFDVGKHTFRNDLYPQYKAHRKETDHALALQIPRVKQIVETLNIPLVAQQGLEADDLIGSLTKIAAKKGLHSVIVTGDNDSLQLVNDSTEVYSLHRGVTDTLTYNRQAVFEKLGVYPNQVIDYKALSGDASDNIPGAPGIGPKTAVDLLTKYQTLDGIYQHLDELKERTSQILKDNKAQVYLSQKLATIKTDLDIELNLKEADVANFHFESVVNLFQELDFKSLLTKLPQVKTMEQTGLFVMPQQKKLEENSPADEQPKLLYEAVTTIERWHELIDILEAQEVLVIDTETVDLGGELIGISFSWGVELGAYLPVGPVYQPALPLEKVAEGLKKILENKDIKKVGHNIKYDLHALSRAGFQVKNVWFDTMIASQLINSQLFSHGIDDLAFSLLGFKKIPTLHLLGKKTGKMTDVPLDELAAYACEDVIITWRLYEKFRPDIEAQHIKKVFYEIEMPLISVLQKMEERGIKIDKKHLENLREELTKSLRGIEADVWRLAGHQFNIASPSQLQKVLFQDLKLPANGLKKIKSGYSTDVGTLIKLSGKHEIIAKILEHRELAKLLSTYVETLPLQCDQHDRIHTSYVQIGAATGRMASTNPNLQNIPIRTELGNSVRRAFIAEKGCQLLSADYSQVELRILAHMSGDPGLIDAFKEGDDFHTAVSKQLGVTRREAKAINFGIIYGLGASALATDIGKSPTEAREFIDKYFARFPKVQQFIEEKKRVARENGYVSTLFGRRRYLPDIHSPNMMLRSAAERMAVNHPCQGTVADIMKLAMISMDNKLPSGANMLLQIHDELLFEVDASGVDKLSTLVWQTMDRVTELKVPLIVDIHTGNNWAELKS